jgi:RNA polymerase sigma-70 factor (ECF subfamily)
MIAALDGLPQHYREALMLVAVLGESYITAAQIMDCDIGTVKSRVCRARRILRTILEPEF